MTAGKTSVLIATMVGGTVLGMWLAPRVTPLETAFHHPPAVATASAPAAGPAVAAAAPAVEPETAAPAATARIARAAYRPSDRFLAREQPLLEPGTNMTVAARGFHSATQFASIARASRNLNVPFVLLKDRTVTRHMSLQRAIHTLKPGVNARIEADRALAEARSDVLEPTIE